MPGDGLRRGIARIERLQRERSFLAFPIAVGKKFGDDGAGGLAALIAYYGFFSLFPLLLVLVTVLGFALSGDPSLQHDILHGALARFPVVGDQIRHNVGSLTGSGLALGVGLGVALWAGLGAVRATQSAMNRVWNVPKVEQRGFVSRTLRAVAFLAVLGVATVVATAAAGFASSGGSSIPVKALGIAVAAALNFGIFLAAFLLLTDARLRVGDVVPGAVIAAAVWLVLQSFGGYFVEHQIKDASTTYGTFAVVIGLLAWLHLGAQTTLLAAEVNVVRARGLWPRSLVRPLTGADKDVLGAATHAARAVPEQRVEVAFDDGDHPDTRPGASTRRR